MVIGASTTVLASLNAGDSILDLVGPLGKKQILDLIWEL